MELFDKKFVYLEWDDALEGKEVFVAYTLSGLKRAIALGDRFVIKKNDGDYSFISSGGVQYAIAYYDPNYEYKLAYNQGKKVEVYGFIGISRAWVEVTDDLKWEENYQYRIKPKKFTLIEPDCNNDKLRLLSECTPVHVDEHAFLGTREECKDYAVKNFCDCCVHTDSPCVWYDCTGFVSKNKCKWRPFKDIAELKHAWEIKRSPLVHPELEEPAIWVRKKSSGITSLIDRYDYRNSKYPIAVLGRKSMQELFDEWEFLDGTPCGMED